MNADFTTWMHALRQDGLRLADVIEQLDPEVPVPSCPDWTVRDLVRHTGRVHRWAGLMIAESRSEPPGNLQEILPAGWPSDDRLAGWFRKGHTRLVSTLEDAPPDLQCWTIMDAPSPRDFWARRQAHETSIHRIDAELAAGTLSGFEQIHAADGIDELLVWFIGRPGRGPAAPENMTLGVDAVDVGRQWTVSFGPEGAEGRSGRQVSDCTISGSAADLYPYLWSRTPLGELKVTGDTAVLEQWQESSAF